MSKFVHVIVEGQTEQKFIQQLLAPYCAANDIFLTASLVSKKGANGGDVKFQRVERDIMHFLNQRRFAAVSTFVDYYGIKEWPGKESIEPHFSPKQIADTLNQAAMRVISNNYNDLAPQKRFIPFVAVHEFETLLFSDSKILADSLRIEHRKVIDVLEECGTPEEINNGPATAPSKRLAMWLNGKYGKTTLGISIAQEIGIDKMRQACPLFHNWLTALEQL